MSTQGFEVKARVILTLAVVKRGRTIYLKIPKDINEGSLGFENGDNVQIGILDITHKGGSSAAPRMKR